MSLILNINTSMDSASVCLARNGTAIQIAENENQKDHASWLHVAIKKLFQIKNLSLSDLDAVAVSIGPGSYTGLRVGLSAAKGFCFSLNIPLLAVGTLEIMANAARGESVELLCPMIDARRHEVFTAVFDKEMKIIMPPQAMIVSENSFDSFLLNHQVLFFGNGSEKVKPVIQHKNASYKKITNTASSLAYLSTELMKKKQFDDMAYIEPLYIKEFYTNFHLPLI